MPRSAMLGFPTPYHCFGTFAGLPFWPGGLTLLAAAPGIGKTSWLLRMIAEAAAAQIPAALGCYEHTPEELQYRLRLQSQAAAAGPHQEAHVAIAEQRLARARDAVLLELFDREDTVRALEETLLKDYRFPEQAPAMVAVDYLQRVPVAGLTGLLPEGQRAGEAAAALRTLARRRQWAIIAASALRLESLAQTATETGLADLLGDERVPYEADRILLVRRTGDGLPCGCARLEVISLKDRTGPPFTRPMMFWGSRFYPALADEVELHQS